jgi:hypothetical protein
MNMTRREALIKMAVLVGATTVGPRLLGAKFRESAAAKGSLEPFAADDIVLLDEIGDTIIPATDVPGAKAVGIGAFIAMMVTDCYYPDEQRAFRKGLHGLPAAYQAKYGESFITGKPASRTEFLNQLDQEQKAYTAKQKGRKKFVRENATTEESADSEGEIPHYFRVMKELTILGYFTSELASTQILGWEEVPGRFDGNMPYKKGDKPGTEMRV